MFDGFIPVRSHQHRKEADKCYMDWISVTSRTKYINIHDSLVIAYHLSDKSIVMIDSGGSKSPEFLSAFRQQGLSVRFVLCTHLHPDHTGNLPEIINLYHPDVFASKYELSAPYYHPFYDGDRPLELALIDQVRELRIAGERFEIFPTFGHSAGHLAFVTPDGVCCLGDALLTKDVLCKSKIPYLADVDQAILSMEQIRQTTYPYYILSHSGVVLQKAISGLVDINIKKELDLYRILRQQITEPMHIDALTDKFLTAARVRDPGVFSSRAYRETVQSRIFGLIKAGEVTVSSDIVYPGR